MLQNLADTMRNMSVRGKLKVTVVSLAAALVFGSIVSGTCLFALKTSVSSFVSITDAHRAIAASRIDINNVGRLLQEMVLKGNPSEISAYRQEIEVNKKDILERIHRLDEQEYIDHGILASYQSGLQNWYGIVDQILEIASAGRMAESAVIIQESCIPVLNQLVTETAQIDREIEDQMDKKTKISLYVYILSMIFNSVLMVQGIAFSLFLSKKLFEDIFIPIEAVEQAARKMETGHLALELSSKNRDEMGQMSDSLKRAADTLSGYIKDISRAMSAFSQGNFDVKPEMEWTGDFHQIYLAVYDFQKNMSKLVTEIYSVAEQVERSAAQVAGSSGCLAEGASDQASIIEHLAETIESVSEQVSKNAGHARQISRSVEGVSTDIINSNAKMSEMVSSMQEINDSSNKIRNIIATINDIASQTNLLALNASIEAARAGEAGRGFAVVADQVSVLAAQSAQAAKESTHLIESSVGAVEKGMIIAAETAGQLAVVVDSSQKITQEVSHVADALGKQAEAFIEINAGVEHINEVVQNNSAVSEECAAASQEMNAQAEGLERLLRSFKVLKLEE